MSSYKMSNLKLLHLFSTFAVGGPQMRTASMIHAFDPRIEHLLMVADGCLDGIDALNLRSRVRIIEGSLKKGTGVALSNLSSNSLGFAD